jgi:hypothetical protein
MKYCLLYNIGNDNKSDVSQDILLFGLFPRHFRHHTKGSRQPLDNKTWTLCCKSPLI